jgi:hypothetical protein
MLMGGESFHGLTARHGPARATAAARVWSESRRKANPNSRNRRLNVGMFNQT